MNEPIVVDMALALKQMQEMPDLTKAISNAMLDSVIDDVAFEGYVTRTRHRYVDADKNPITAEHPLAKVPHQKGEWSNWRYQQAYATRNPYVYQKGRHNSPYHRFVEAKDNGTYERPTYKGGVGQMDWRTYQEEISKWEATRKIVGYCEQVCEVREASIVVWKD